MSTLNLKNKLKPFAVCHSGLVLGQLIKAKDISDLIEKRLSKKVLSSWEIISFVDSENRNISITKDFLDEGMTMNQVIEDWINNGDIKEPILALNPSFKSAARGTSVTLSQFTFTINK